MAILDVLKSPFLPFEHSRKKASKSIYLKKESVIKASDPENIPPRISIKTLSTLRLIRA